MEKENERRPSRREEEKSRNLGTGERQSDDDG